MIEAVSKEQQHLPSVICVVVQRAQSYNKWVAAATSGQAGRSRRAPDPLTGYYYSNTFFSHTKNIPLYSSSSERGSY